MFSEEINVCYVQLLTGLDRWAYITDMYVLESVRRSFHHPMYISRRLSISAFDMDINNVQLWESCIQNIKYQTITNY